MIRCSGVSGERETAVQQCCFLLDNDAFSSGISSHSLIDGFRTVNQNISFVSLTSTHAYITGCSLFGQLSLACFSQQQPTYTSSEILLQLKKLNVLGSGFIHSGSS